MIVEKYPFQIPFTLVRLRDADTVIGTILLPVQTFIPVLGLAAEGSAPLKVVVRLEGVAAPENDTPEGKRATAWVENWFQTRPIPLWLHTAGRLDFAGRWLGDIRVNENYYTGLALDLLQSEHGEPYKRSLHESW